MKNNNITVLVNTTDSFEDCWIPFFTLFKKYWPEYSGTIYLNTETKVFQYPGLDIVSVQNSKNMPDVKITWSECLLRALKIIDGDVFLYLQEDYFFKDYVKSDIVQKYFEMMRDNWEIHCIHLTDQAVIPDKQIDSVEGLYKILLKQRYRISCQAALWQKNVLRSYLRNNESAWAFEEYGSKRAEILSDNFFVVDNHFVRLNEFEIIPYIFTGIIQGRWYEEVVQLFADNDIHIDYSRRGFSKDSKPKSLKLKIQYVWGQIPILFSHYRDIVKLKEAKRNKIKMN